MHSTGICAVHGDQVNRLILTILFATGLAACAPLKRVSQPAPIITAGRSAPKPSAPPPKKGVAKVYPYRSPASASDAPTPWGTVPARESRQAKAGSVSEPATKSTSKQGTRARPAKVPPKTVTPALQTVAAASQPPSSLSRLSPAASTLIKQAEQQRRAGDHVAAAVNLERALGIQPLEPYVWNRLARVRMAQGRYVQARNLASRSNVLAGGEQSAITRDNWNIIAAASQAVGDTAGAVKAQLNARGG